MATSAEIKATFKAAYDSFGFNFSNNQPNELFERAQNVYWGNLADKWGMSLEVNIDLQPQIKEANITPSSNEIDLSVEITDYNRLGYVKPRYVVNGKTYEWAAKPLPISNRYSVYSEGTYRYPRYYLIQDTVVLQPSATPTNVNVIYVKNYESIDFSTPLQDIPITERNVQGIVDQALRLAGTMQREFDYANQIAQEGNITKNL